MQQQASVSRLSVHLCLNFSSVLNYFHSNKGDLVVDGKLHCKREAGVEAVFIFRLRTAAMLATLTLQQIFFKDCK